MSYVGYPDCARCGGLGYTSHVQAGRVECGVCLERRREESRGASAVAPSGSGPGPWWVRAVAGGQLRFATTLVVVGGGTTIAAPYLVAAGLSRSDVFRTAAGRASDHTIVLVVLAMTALLWIVVGGLRRASCRRWLGSGAAAASLYRRNVGWSLLRTSVVVGGLGMSLALAVSVSVTLGGDPLPIYPLAETPASFQIAIVVGILLVWSLLFATVPTRRYVRRAGQ